MTKEKDARLLSPIRTDTERLATLERAAMEVNRRLPEKHRISIATGDGGSSVVVVASDGAQAERGDYRRRALEHARLVAPVLGVDSDSAEFSADVVVAELSSGSKLVNLRQRYMGIPILDATITVLFTPEGAIKRTMAQAFSTRRTANELPRLSATEALVHAASHLAQPDRSPAYTNCFGEPVHAERLNLDGFTPRVIAGSDSPERAAVFEAGPFAEPITASLIWFPLNDELRLGWSFLLKLQDFAGKYYIIVDAGSGEILYSQQRLRSADVNARVYLTDPNQPRDFIGLPPAVSDYDVAAPPLPSGFPDAWVRDDLTSGNSTFAKTDGGGAVLAATSLAGDLVFDFDENSNEQRVLNAFYFCCYIHDFYYLLGFKETDRNYQASNLGRGGTGGDRLTVVCHPGAINGTANMDGNDSDGLSPTMNLGFVTSSGRHTALDSSVVYHEYTHAVVERLLGKGVGGGVDAPQSRGLNEGWSDYIACCINNSDVVGAWALNRTSGARGFRYDTKYPDHFGLLGSGRYAADASGNPQDAHNVGEIWCAALLDVNRRIGKQLALQLVVDGLKITFRNPNFLTARDGLFIAADEMQWVGKISWRRFAQAIRGIWSASARFGFGEGATSSFQLTGVVPSFNVLRPLYPREVLVSAVTTRLGGVSLFALGIDGVVRSKFRDLTNPAVAGNQGWSGWFPIGGAAFAPGTAVTAVSSKPGGVSLFAVGGDGVVLSAHFDPDNLGPPQRGGWSEWFPITGASFSEDSVVSAVSSKRGGVNLAAVGVDQLVHCVALDPDRLGSPKRSGWSDWIALDGARFGKGTVVSAVTNGPGRVSVFATNPIGEVQSAFFDPANPGPSSRGGWSDWFVISNPKPLPASSPVAAVASKPGQVSLFVLSSAREVMSAYYDPDNLGPSSRGGWSEWFSIPGTKFPPGTTVSAISTKRAGVSLFGVADEGQVQSAYWDPTNLGPASRGGWSNWFALGPNAFPSPTVTSACSTVPDGVSLFLFGFDETVWSREFDPPTAAGAGHWSDWFSLGF